MMTRTLPFSDVVVVWDAVMSQPALDRNFNPRLEHLVDISAAILVRARGRIMQSVAQIFLRAPNLPIFEIELANHVAVHQFHRYGMVLLIPHPLR